MRDCGLSGCGGVYLIKDVSPDISISARVIFAIFPMEDDMLGFLSAFMLSRTWLGRASPAST